MAVPVLIVWAAGGAICAKLQAAQQSKPSVRRQTDFKTDEATSKSFKQAWVISHNAAGRFTNLWPMCHADGLLG